MDITAQKLPETLAETPLEGPPGTPPEKPLWRTFVVFLGPMMLANLLQSLSGTVNNIYLGHMIGVQALAAATGFFPVIFFFVAYAMGLSAGTTVLVGQAWGAGELHKIKAIAGSALFVAIVSGLAVAVFGGLFTGPLMRALGTPPDILAPATAYARVMLLSMPLLFVMLLITSMLRGVGDSVIPLWTLGLSTAVGLIVTPALIAGWGGLPRLGVASAAVAAPISLLVALTWLAALLRRRGHVLAPDGALLRAIRPDPVLLAKIMRIGVPTAVQVMTIALAELVLLGLVNRFGSGATAAYGAVNQVLAYVQFPAVSIAMAASILAAQSIGAGRTDRLGDIAKTAIVLNLVLTGAGVALIYLFSRPVVGLFITDPAVVELTQQLLHIVVWSIVVFGMSTALAAVMRASGAVLVPTAISMLAMILVEAPTAWFLSHRIGVTGVWIAYPTAFVTMLIAQTAYYNLVWRKRPIRRLI